MSAALSGSASAVTARRRRLPGGFGVLGGGSAPRRPRRFGARRRVVAAARPRRRSATQRDHPEHDQAGEDRRDEPGQRPQGPRPGVAARLRRPRATGGRRASGRGGCRHGRRSGSGGGTRREKGRPVRPGAADPHVGARQQDRRRVAVATGGQLASSSRTSGICGRSAGSAASIRVSGSGQRSGPPRRQDLPARPPCAAWRGRSPPCRTAAGPRCRCRAWRRARRRRWPRSSAAPGPPPARGRPACR